MIRDDFHWSWSQSLNTGYSVSDCHLKWGGKCADGSTSRPPQCYHQCVDKCREPNWITGNEARKGEWWVRMGRNDFHSVFMCRHSLMVRIVECGWPLNFFYPSSWELSQTLAWLSWCLSNTLTAMLSFVCSFGCSCWLQSCALSAVYAGSFHSVNMFTGNINIVYVQLYS